MGNLFSRQKTVTDAQIRISSEIAAVRAKGGVNTTFFTQTTSAPNLQTNQSFLVNICPLTAYLGGYLGPPEQVMDANFYLQTAFAAGIRSFFLPITTYLNPSKIPPVWPYSGTPLLVARDTSDTIISVNGISLTQFITALLEYKSVSGYSSEPILLFLDDALSDIDRSKINYVKFMKTIASQLQALDPYRVSTAGSYGSIVGGKNQKKLLTEIPLSFFANRVIIFTSFDTAQDDTQSLASYANFIYSPTNNTLPAREIVLEDVSGSTVNLVASSRTNWMIAKSRTPLVVPTADTVQKALASGIQCVPIPFMGASMDSVSDLWRLWNGASYSLKQEAARYTAPAPVVPASASARLNASIEGKEPGTLVVH